MERIQSMVGSSKGQHGARLWFRAGVLCAALGMLGGCGSEWGFAGGPDGTTEVVMIDLDAGVGTLYDTDGAGGFLPIRTHTNWYRGWDTVVTGDFGGFGQDDFVFADLDRGIGAVTLSDGEGNLEQVAFHDNWYTGWNTVIAGNFDGEGRDDLLFVDYQVGSAEFSGLAVVYSLEDRGQMEQVSAHDNWFTGWDAVVAGDFLPSATNQVDDLVLADFDSGFLAVVRNDGSAGFSQVGFQDGLGSGWDQLLTGDFNGDAAADILIVDFDQGIAAFYVSDGSGGLELLYRQENWSRAWDTAAVGDFGGSGHSDILLLDRSTGTVGTYVTDGTGRQTQLALIEDFDHASDLIVAARPRSNPEFSYPDPALFVEENFTRNFAEKAWVGEAGGTLEVPTLLVLLDNPVDSTASDPRRDFTKSIEFHRDRVFGSEDADSLNLRDFFLENSDGRFRLVEADGEDGVLGPLRYPSLAEVPLGEGNPRIQGDEYGERFRSHILRKMAKAGFDFEGFDQNGDGKVSNRELILILVAATPGRVSQGANRGTYPSCLQPKTAWFPGDDSDSYDVFYVPRPDVERPVGVEACLNIGSVSDNAAFSMFAHEVSHTLGAIDLYGQNCNDFRATLMSCSGGVDATNVVTHLDAWHKLYLGWEEVDAYRLNEAGSCVSLSDQGIDGSGGADVAILWDPERNRNEYFLLEHRNQSGSVYEQNLSYLGVAGSSLMVWNVTMDASGMPVRGGGMGTRTTYELTQAVSPATAPTGGPFTRADGEFRLNWSDGTDAGVVLRVGDGGDELDVAWARGDLASHPTWAFNHASDPAAVNCYERVVD